MRSCPSCYRQVEDPEHVICPDCGTILPKPDQMSSEDASDSLFKDSETARLEEKITELVNENANLQAQVDAYKEAIERGKGNDCPPDGDAISTCPIDTDKDCTACWAEYLLKQI